MTQALKFPTGWAIVGRRGRRGTSFSLRGSKPERIARFSGGRSRRKLETNAAWMNASGEYVVAVRWYGPSRLKAAKLDRARAQRAARKARRRGEAR